MAQPSSWPTFEKIMNFMKDTNIHSGVTQQEIADGCDIGKSTVSRIMKRYPQAFGHCRVVSYPRRYYLSTEGLLLAAHEQTVINERQAAAQRDKVGVNKVGVKIKILYCKTSTIMWIGCGRSTLPMNWTLSGTKTCSPMHIHHSHKTIRWTTSGQSRFL